MHTESCLVNLTIRGGSFLTQLQWSPIPSSFQYTILYIHVLYPSTHSLYKYFFLEKLSLEDYQLSLVFPFINPRFLSLFLVINIGQNWELLAAIDCCRKTFILSSLLFNVFCPHLLHFAFEL